MNECCANKKPSPLSKLKPYQPLIVMVIMILIATTAISQSYGLSWMPLFMGLFFLNFAMFKLFDIAGFAKSFAMYDIVAKKSALYAKAYPFIELALGIAYLCSFNLYAVNIFTAIIMSIGLIGIVQNKLSGSATKCACMGSLIDVPVGTATILENVSMAIMALAMLIVTH